MSSTEGRISLAVDDQHSDVVFVLAHEYSDTDGSLHIGCLVNISASRAMCFFSGPDFEQQYTPFRKVPERVGSPQGPPGPVEVDGYDEWVVGGIIGHEDAQGCERLYRVRWEGYGPEEDTMECWSNLVRNAKESVDEYEAGKGKQANKRAKGVRQENRQGKRRPGLRTRNAKKV